jgi:hypothetical protein
MKTTSLLKTTNANPISVVRRKFHDLILLSVFIKRMMLLRNTKFMIIKQGLITINQLLIFFLPFSQCYELKTCVYTVISFVDGNIYYF